MLKKRVIGLCALLLIVALAGAFCVGFFHLDYNWGADQYFQNLQVEAELTEKGSLHVTETWQVQYNDRGRPYWNNVLYFRQDMVGTVSDLTVYDADYRQYYTFAEGATAFDAAERSCYISENTGLYELGWIYPRLDSGVRNFVVTYTLGGMAENYADSDTLAHAFVPSGNTFPVRRFSLRVRFPNESGNTRQVHAWLHGPQGGQVTLEDANTLYAEAEHIPAMRAVELRLLLPPDSVQGEPQLSGAPMAAQVMAEEEQYTAAHDMRTRFRYLFWLLHAALAALAVLGAVRFLRWQDGREKAALKGKAPLMREIPSSNSPAVVGRLYFAAKPGEDRARRDSYALAATVLTLAHKRWLLLEPDGEDGLRIVVKQEGKSQPVGEEKNLLELLRVIALKHGGGFTLDEFRQFGRDNPQKMQQALHAFNDTVSRRFHKQGWIRQRRLVNSRAGQVAVGCVVLALVVLAAGALPGYGILALGLLVAGVLCGLFSMTRSPMTQKGLKELLHWRGFVKYLREYSVLTEQPETEVSLWGDYMVYASALGLGKVLSSQLALVYDRLVRPGEDTPPDVAQALDGYVPPNPVDHYFDFTPEEGAAYTDRDIWRVSAFGSSVAQAVRDAAGGLARKKQKAQKA